MNRCLNKNIEEKPTIFARIAFRMYARKFGNRGVYWNKFMSHPPSNPDSKEGCYYCHVCMRRWNAVEEELNV